jgi:hypothetical protein
MQREVRFTRLPNLTRKPNYGKEVPKQKNQFLNDLFDFSLSQFSERPKKLLQECNFVRFVNLLSRIRSN